MELPSLLFIHLISSADVRNLTCSLLKHQEIRRNDLSYNHEGKCRNVEANTAIKYKQNRNKQKPTWLTSERKRANCYYIHEWKHSERNEEKKDTLVPGAGVQIWRSKILEVTLLLLNISTGAYRKSLSFYCINKSGNRYFTAVTPSRDCRNVVYIRSVCFIFLSSHQADAMAEALYSFSYLTFNHVDRFAQSLVFITKKKELRKTRRIVHFLVHFLVQWVMKRNKTKSA